MGQVNGAFPPGFLGMQPGLHSQAESPQKWGQLASHGHEDRYFMARCLVFCCCSYGGFLTIEMLV